MDDSSTINRKPKLESEEGCEGRRVRRRRQGKLITAVVHASKGRHSARWLFLTFSSDLGSKRTSYILTAVVALAPVALIALMDEQGGGGGR